MSTSGSVFYLVVATFLWGFWGFANKRAVMLSHPFEVQWAYAIPFALAIPAFWLLARRVAPGVPITLSGTAWSLAAGLSTLAGLLCLLHAMRIGSAGTAVTFTAAYPIVTLLLLWLTGLEALTPTRLLGCALVVAGLVVMQWEPAPAAATALATAG